ncbi:MAG: SUMF1/EgtB/PvdO family nonheme iron enzyme [Myxococcota bacterium]
MSDARRSVRALEDGWALFEASRARTLAFVRELPDDVLASWPDAEFSPICWHLGHVAYTEARWALAEVLGDRRLVDAFVRRFDQKGCPKAERADGYDRGALFAYLEEVRDAVRARRDDLGAHPLLEGGYLPWFLACHEDQHRETMAYVLGMVRQNAAPPVHDAPPLADDGPAPRMNLAGGALVLGHDRALAYDNERPGTPAEVGPFGLDGHPVTSAAWMRFMDAGGYADNAFWDDEGWTWREREEVRSPRGWVRAGGGVWRARLGGWRAVDGREPVCGVSWWEARAYARWAGGRLPREAEWELAARDHGRGRILDLIQDGPRPVAPGAPDLLGNVWEWTEDAFAPRPGFVAHPYRGYSAPYFDGVHRVLRGGSFATHPRVARPRFRNWYVPETRQIFAGLRLAYDA